MMEAAIKFLSTCQKRKTLNRKRTSYGWKHIAERRIGTYVSNEQLIAAARQMGFRVQMIRGLPNAFINISERAAQ